MQSIDYLSPTENTFQDGFSGPDLGAAFNDKTDPPTQDQRREYTMQNWLLNSYTTRADDVQAQYQGLDLESRRALIGLQIDALGQYDNTTNLEQAIESKKLEVDVLSSINVSNDKARDVQDTYKFAWHHARPVQNLEDADQIGFTKDYMDNVKAGYNAEDHTVKIGEITYAADQNETLGRQFAEQFKDIEQTAQYAYTQDPVFGDVEFANGINESGLVNYDQASRHITGEDEFGCVEITKQTTEAFDQKLTQVHTNIQNDAAPVNDAPDISTPN